MILFIVAFLLMALSFLMHLRSNEEVIGTLQSSVTTLQELQESQDKNVQLQSQLDDANKKAGDLQSQLDESNAAKSESDENTAALLALYTLQQQYATGNRDACKQTIQAMHYSELSFPFRRFQIGKVYRGERAQRGRFREFYQADIDIIGDGSLAPINDAEIPAIIYKVFSTLGLKRFQIRVNNRKILNGFYAMTAQMTLEEKVGQLFFSRVPETDAAADVSAYHLGGYILFGRDTKDKTANEIIQAINGYQEAADIPLLIGVDEEGGTVVRVSSNPNIRAEKFRSPQQLYAAGGMFSISSASSRITIFR